LQSELWSWRLCCSLPVQAHRDHRVKRERRAKKEPRDLLGRWDQKAMRVRQAQWDQKAIRVRKDRLDRPVPQAAQVSGS